MKSNRSIYRLLLCAGLVCNLATAQSVPPAQGTPLTQAGIPLHSGTSQPKYTPEPFKWLSKAEEQALADAVPPPPAPNSVEDQADLAAILEAQKTRTPEIAAESKRDQGFSYKLFQSVYGNDLTPENSPKFHLLMRHVLDATGFVNGTAKGKYRRLRPYQGHPDVVTSLFIVGGFSYPSGHSMASFTLAVVLGSIFPDKQQAFLDCAGRIAESRVNAGVHYPSDIKEGELLGKATAAAILANPSFQKDMAEVRTELKK